MVPLVIRYLGAFLLCYPKSLVFFQYVWTLKKVDSSLLFALYKRIHRKISCWHFLQPVSKPSHLAENILVHLVLPELLKQPWDNLARPLGNFRPLEDIFFFRNQNQHVDLKGFLHYNQWFRSSTAGVVMRCLARTSSWQYHNTWRASSLTCPNHSKKMLMISLGVMTEGNIMSLALFCGEYAFNFQAPNYSPGVQLPVTQGLLSPWTAIKNWMSFA